MAKEADVIMPETGRDELRIKITADTTEFEKAVGRCIEKVKELTRLIEQVGELSAQAGELFSQLNTGTE